MFRFILFALIAFSQVGFSQQNFSFSVVDAQTKAGIPGARVAIDSLAIGGMTSPEGLIELMAIPYGTHVISIRSVGYTDRAFTMSFPTRQPEPAVIELEPDTDLHEIIIEGTRGNKSISDTPTRTEALTDEIDEAASMEPGKVSHLLTHTTGIQVQTTSATSNGAVIRIQGLNGRYTQLLKDGFPMYGGFSGSLDILQIAPLDLRQVEFIKGPASTLYGGGAIGGIVNLLTKTPSVDEILLHINYSNIGSRDFNAFVSRNFGKFGFTNLASLHIHNAYDADRDGFSDLAQVSKFNFNPKLFYAPNRRWSFYLGANITKENRSGGDMNRIANQSLSIADFYLDYQTSQRFSTQFRTICHLSEKSILSIKNSFSVFNRYIAIQENLTEAAIFGGDQLNSYTEINYRYSHQKHTLNTGFNFITDQFNETGYAGTDTLRNQNYQTIGSYLNHVWDITQKISIEGGLRGDYVMAGSEINSAGNQVFILPRLSTLFRLTKRLSLRIGGGMGYRMPTIFNEEAEPIAYKNIAPIDFQNTKAEESTGGNFDLKYTTSFGRENLLLSFNQMFFYNVIDNPIFLIPTAAGRLEYQNYGDRIHSRGFETQLKFTFWKITWFLGYTYNQAFLERTFNYWLTLTPQHSIKGDLLFVEEDKWRIGLDYEYKSAQWLSEGLQTPAIFMSGIVIERTLGNFVLFFNAENFTDVRQTKYESIVSSPNNTPQQTEIWAPLDGRFFNGGLKIKL